MSEVNDADANPPPLEHFSTEPGPTDSSDSDDKASSGGAGADGDGSGIPVVEPGVENGGSEGNPEAEVPPQLPPTQEALEPVSDADDGSSRSFPWGPRTADGDDAGSEEEQAAFMRELESFFRGRGMEFKPPKFYGEGLNCLKLWRAVIKLGGYDTVTSCKLWRQVGESFNPPRTCTTVSWSFRCFYEKALLDYERHKVRCGELNVHVASPIESVAAETQVVRSQALGPVRVRRDAAARAMQEWHSRGLLGNGYVVDSLIKDKSPVYMPKQDKQVKSLELMRLSLILDLLLIG